MTTIKSEKDNTISIELTKQQASLLKEIIHEEARVCTHIMEDARFEEDELEYIEAKQRVDKLNRLYNLISTIK